MMAEAESKLNCLAGCALSSSDGWTYLNEDARAAIKEAAATIRAQAQEIERLNALTRKAVLGKNRVSGPS